MKHPGLAGAYAIAVTVLFGFLGPPTWASEAAPLCSAVVSAPFAKFDPVALLKRHGLDPNQIRFRANMDARKGEGQFGVLRWGIRVDYGGEEVGFMGVFSSSNDFDRTKLYVSVSEIREDAQGLKIRGTGLGAIMYLITGKIAHEKWGLTFGKSYQISDEATNLWKRLSTLGYVNPETFEFEREAVSNGSLEELQKFFDARLESHPEWGDRFNAYFGGDRK